LIYFISAAYALGENKFARGLSAAWVAHYFYITALHAASVLIVWLALILNSATLANYFKKRAARVEAVFHLLGPFLSAAHLFSLSASTAARNVFDAGP
jgi:hypothetical protein